jgi:hypothetical protein
MKTILIICLSVLMCACATQTYTMRSAGSAVPNSSSMQTFFISGLGQEKVTDAAAVCGGANKVYKVSSYSSFLDIVLSTLTWGIYTPRDSEVYCIR